MEPILDGNGNVTAYCPTCKAAANFQYVAETQSKAALYKFTRCARCSRGGMAETVTTTEGGSLRILEFNPKAIDRIPLPRDVPFDIRNELEEAEVCMAAGAYRAASIMLRSLLERVFQDSGYTDAQGFRTLTSKIAAASDDQIIPATRLERAKTIIETLGDEVGHREWRAIAPEEVALSRHYCQRILEDMYDDRDIVERTLLAKERTTTTL